MSLKKILKRCEKGQVLIEYFILFALIAAVSIAGVSTLIAKTQKSTERYTNRAIHKLAPVLPYSGFD